jgi:hypothetical protein
MQSSEFHHPVSIDSVPHGSLCQWCGKQAVKQLTAIGGRYHNEGGQFCKDCGEQFARVVTDSLTTSITSQVELHHA